MKITGASVLSSLVLANATVLGAQDAVLRGTIKDASSGGLTPCTVAITDSSGKLLTESESFKAGFRCAGQFTRHLPPGRTRVRITRGFETTAIDLELDLAPGQQADKMFALRRSVDLRARGWYSGDSHVHMLHGERTVPVDFDFVALTARAEDLQYLSLAQAWSLTNPTPERLEAELKRRSVPNFRLTWNLEAPKNYYRGDAGRCLGHCWSLGLRGRTGAGANVISELLDASAWDYESQKPSYANFESHNLVHSLGGAAFYSHPARWWTGSWGGQGGYPKMERMRVSNMAVELPLDTLVGPTFDGLDVITGPGEHAANAIAFELWSMLLNHGYRLAATASSDSCFDRPGGGVPGTPRIYTFVPGGFSLAKVTRATAAGKTFITTGPLLLATVEGAPPGSTLRPGAKKQVLDVEAWASGAAPGGLQRLEILRNGKRFQELLLPDHPSSLRTNFTIQEPETAWYCARVYGSNSQQQVAMTGAFYFADKNHEPPPPLQAHVVARILDAASGQPLRGVVTEVRFEGTAGRDGKRHTLRLGAGDLSVPGTVRLRAEAPGYEPQIQSPFLDHLPLVEFTTRLSAEDLLKWQTFERVRDLLSEVPLTFRLHKRNSSP
ncbi:MAG TPA: CehA/McbA family metallohydrolase [Verrucomicrobiae bacterium]